MNSRSRQSFGIVRGRRYISRSLRFPVEWGCWGNNLDIQQPGDRASAATHTSSWTQTLEIRNHEEKNEKTGLYPEDDLLGITLVLIHVFGYGIELICGLVTPDGLGMMTPSNRNIFRVTGPLWGESTGHLWFLLTKASDGEIWYFLWSAPEG